MRVNREAKGTRERQRIPSKLLLGGALLLLGSTAATADPIGPTCDGGTCQGSIYELTYSSLNGSYAVSLDIDTSGYTGMGEYIDTVAFKISSSIDDATLVSAPDGPWTDPVEATLNAGGCAGGGSGWVCTQATNSGGAVNGTLSWDFIVDIGGDLFTEPFEASVKARYVNAEGEKVGDLVSEDITLQPDGDGNGDNGVTVPEPGALSLLGAGMLGMVWMRRRKQT